MELIILGSGTGIPLPDRGSPCLVMIVNKEPIVFDMGPGSLRQLTRSGLAYEKVRHIFISHFHPDHTTDLIHFMFAIKNPAVINKKDPFIVSGPFGLRKWMGHIQAPYQDWLTLPPEIMTMEEFETQNPDTRDYHGFTLSSAPTHHTPNSLAYRVEEKKTGKTVVYSGDTGVCREIVDLAQNVDLLVLECSFPDEQGMDGHLTPSQAGRIAALARPKQLVLTHFYPECLATDIKSQCRNTYQGELLLAEDMMHIPV